MIPDREQPNHQKQITESIAGAASALRNIENFLNGTSLEIPTKQNPAVFPNELSIPTSRRDRSFINLDRAFQAIVFKDDSSQT